MHSAADVRKNRRGPFLKGEDREGNPWTDDTWCKSNVKPLLTAHYQCDKPGAPTAILDAEYMLETGFARITASRKTKEDGLSPLKLPEAALQEVREWLDEKKAVGGEEGEAFARNCERADKLRAHEEARAENKELHGKTHAALANIPTRDEIEQIERRITDAISASSAAKVTRKCAEWPAGQWAWVEAPPGRAAEAPGGELFFDRGAGKVVVGVAVGVCESVCVCSKQVPISRSVHASFVMNRAPPSRNAEAVRKQKCKKSGRYGENSAGKWVRRTGFREGGRVGARVGGPSRDPSRGARVGGPSRGPE